MENKGCFYSSLLILGIGGLTGGLIGLSVGRAAFGGSILLVSLLSFFVLRYSLHREPGPPAVWLRIWANQSNVTKKEDTVEEVDEVLQKGSDKKKSWEDKLREMDGYEFEEFVANLFEEMGYDTRVTKKSGDQGVDVIAESPFETLAIQAKNLSSKVSNSAVQEIVAARNPSEADKAMVVTTSSFTRSAKQLAKNNNVRLVDREELLDLVDEYIESRL